MVSFDGLGRFKVKRVLLAGTASTKIKSMQKRKALHCTTAVCCLPLITCFHLYLTTNIFSCLSAGFTEVEEDDNEGLKQAIGFSCCSYPLHCGFRFVCWEWPPLKWLCQNLPMPQLSGSQNLLLTALDMLPLSLCALAWPISTDKTWLWLIIVLLPN